MPEVRTPRLGIIAGGGEAPRRVIEACRAQGRSFFVVCLQGQADAETGLGNEHVWLPLGAGSKLKELVSAERITEIVMIGHVRRPSLRELKPDWLSMKVIARIGMNMLGDDGLLRAIGHAMEQECGVTVIGAHEILGGVLTREGPIGKLVPDADATVDIARGIKVARALGEADVGQAVIIQQGLILGVEAIEGTDALIKRCFPLHRAGAGGILVKLAKPQQDDRFDLPTIGPDTINNAAASGLSGIAIEAGRSLLLDREKVKELADAKGIFVIGVR